MFTLSSEALPPVGARNPDCFVHRLQASMTRATVEDSTAGLGHTLRTGRPLVGGVPFHDVSGARSLSHKLPEGIQDPQMQAWSLALEAGQLPVTRTPLRKDPTDSTSTDPITRWSFGRVLANRCKKNDSADPACNTKRIHRKLQQKRAIQQRVPRTTHSVTSTSSHFSRAVLAHSGKVYT